MARPAMFQEFLVVHHEIRDGTTHIQLQDDLAEHLRSHVGNQSPSHHLLFKSIRLRAIIFFITS
jgi:hypothetical protein